jgi:hypothetical protein
VDQVHGAVDRWRALVHGGLQAARTLCVAGRNRERGTRGTR